MLSIGRLVQIFCNVDPPALQRPCFIFISFRIIPQTWRSPPRWGFFFFSLAASVNLPHELIMTRWRAVTAPAATLPFGLFSAAQMDVSTAENQAVPKKLTLYPILFHCVRLKSPGSRVNDA